MFVLGLIWKGLCLLLESLWRALHAATNVARYVARSLARALLQAAATYLQQIRGELVSPVNSNSLLTNVQSPQNAKQHSKLGSDYCALF